MIGKKLNIQINLTPDLLELIYPFVEKFISQKTSNKIDDKFALINIDSASNGNLINDYLQSVQRQIGNNRTDEAIESLLQNLSRSSPLYSDLIMLSSKHKRYCHDFQQGLISLDDREIGIARIENALLIIIKNLNNDEIQIG